MKNSFFANGKTNEQVLDSLVAKSSQDNVYVDCEVVQMQELIGMPVRKGYEQGIISNGKLVNVVSKSYGHLPNEDFFLEAGALLEKADIKFVTRSINRDDRSFAVDYILNDDRYKIEVKQGKDYLFPMLRFVNSYDGSNKTTGSFAFFRKVCDNGLHIAETQISFAVKHTISNVQVVFPKLDNLVANFIDNEFYSLKRKFDILAEQRIYNVEKFVQDINSQMKLFKYESSDKNPLPSANARFVLDVIARETKELNDKPNKWIVYNAFNELLHGKLQKSFDQQRVIDEKLFDVVLAS